MKKIITLLTLTFFLSYSLLAQVVAGGYGFTPVAGTYTNLVGGTNSGIPATGDDSNDNGLPIGFTFNFGGADFTTFSVSSNGLMTFGAGATTTSNTLASTTAGARPGLAPLWDDLQCSSGVTFSTVGTGPNRELIVQWSAMEWNWSSSADVISFQVHLFETTNVLEFHYEEGPDAGNPSGSGGASIGIMGSATTDFISLDNSSAAPTASSSTNTTNIGTKPATGQIYRFAPVDCPTANTASISSSILCDGSSATVTIPVECTPGTLTPFAANTIVGDATWTNADWGVLGGRPFQGGTCCSGSNPPFDLVEFQVDATGSYDIDIAWGGFDGYAFVYTDPLDLTVNPPTSFVAGDDDGGSGSEMLGVSLTAGQTYYLIHTRFGNGASGTYSSVFTGPGNVVSAAPSTSSDITIEWTLDGVAQTTISQACGDVTLSPTFVYSGDGCSPQRQEIAYTIDCDDITTQIDTGTVEVFVYPPFDASLVTTKDGFCGTAPMLEANCPSYIVTQTVGPTVPASGDVGSDTWTIEYNDGPGGTSCFTENVDVDYECTCPTYVASTIDETEVCDGGTAIIDAVATCPLPTTPFAPFAGNVINGTATWSNADWGVLGGRPFSGGTCCSGDNPPFDLVEFQVDVTGAYDITVAWGGFDGYLLVYTDPFDLTANPPTGFVAGSDDFGGTGGSQTAGVNLVAGQNYYVIHTRFGNGAADTYTTTFTGPGNAGTPPITGVIASDVTVNWTIDGIAQTAVAQACGDISLNPTFTYTGDGCNTQVQAVAYDVVCDDSGDVISSGTHNVTVFPPFDADQLVITPGVCGTAATITTACANYVVTAPAAPTSPAPGDVGNDVWTVSYNAGPAPAGTLCFEDVPVNAPYSCGCGLVIVASCPSACNPADNTHSVELTILYTDAAAESITATVDGMTGTSSVLVAGASGTTKIIVSGINSDGASHNYAATYTTSTTCVAVTIPPMMPNYTAPAACGDCSPADAGTIQN